MQVRSMLSLLLGAVLATVGVNAQDPDALKKALAAGNVSAIFPEDATYANASQPYNLRYTVKPIAIAYPTTPEQVSVAVKAGAAQKLRVVARSGGHSYIANGLGGKNGALVVDLSKNKQITVDDTSKTAVIETGLRIGEIAVALNDHGRAMPHGRCTYVGIGGHSGYGGYGHMSRMWGLALDVVQGATVVLANGTIAQVSETAHPDLLWAIRGSSPSFGIVTSIEVKTFPAPANASIFTYQWDLDAANATHLLSSFQNFSLSAIPPELGGELFVLKGSAAGRVALLLNGGYWGPATNFNATIDPLLDVLPAPANTTVVQGTWIEGLAAWVFPSLNTTGPDNTDTFYVKSVMTPEAAPMSEATMASFISYLANEGYVSDLAFHVEVELFGGTNSAMNTIPLNATAFAHRSSLFNFQLYAYSPNGLPPFPSDGFKFVEGMQESILKNEPKDWDWGAYINYVDDRLPDWQKLYYGPHYGRLTQLKREYDPTDVFHFPTSIQE